MALYHIPCNPELERVRTDVGNIEYRGISETNVTCVVYIYKAGEVGGEDVRVAYASHNVGLVGATTLPQILCVGVVSARHEPVAEAFKVVTIDKFFDRSPVILIQQGVVACNGIARCRNGDDKVGCTKFKLMSRKLNNSALTSFQ